MFLRIEVAQHPEFADPAASELLRQVELSYPAIRKKIRWARCLEVFWFDFPMSREEMIPAINEVFWDPVLKWMFSGNLIPSAAGKHGSILDLMEAAPHRPGRFWALETRYRPGVTDHSARSALTALEVVAGRSLPEGRTASGSLLLLEGPQLDEETLAVIAREVLCNEMMETWTLYSEAELIKSDRFHQERIRRDLPKMVLRGADRMDTFSLGQLPAGELAALARKRNWNLSEAEMIAIQQHFANPALRELRQAQGLGDPTEVELETFSRCWSEAARGKLLSAEIRYQDNDPLLGGPEISREIDGLHAQTVGLANAEMQRPWMLAEFQNGTGALAFDDDDAITLRSEVHSDSLALDPRAGTASGSARVVRGAVAVGPGARPFAVNDVLCTGALDYAGPLPERLRHPRRVLAGFRAGLEQGITLSGVPVVGGAMVFDERFLGKPQVVFSSAGLVPRALIPAPGNPDDPNIPRPGDRLCVVGSAVGRDGFQPPNEMISSTLVQRVDPTLQKKVLDLILEAREMGLVRSVTTVAEGGLSVAAFRVGYLAGGVRVDLASLDQKISGLKPSEIWVSETLERMLVALDREKHGLFMALAERRGVPVADLGELTRSGHLEVDWGTRRLAFVELDFIQHGCPRVKLDAVWSVPAEMPQALPGYYFSQHGRQALLELLARPNIASKEWLQRGVDHELQGASVLKAFSGPIQPGESHVSPNDCSVLRPKSTSSAGVAIATGVAPRYSDWDPYLMAQGVVDEAVRNVVAAGGEYGNTDSVLALAASFSWADPTQDSFSLAGLVRGFYGLRQAALELSTPILAGNHAFSEEYRGQVQGKDVRVPIPGTLTVTAVARVPEVRYVRSADFKSPGDGIYVLGAEVLGLVGSEYHSMRPGNLPGTRPRLPEPRWDGARRIYAWLGGTQGKEQVRLRSVHDISDGGLLVAVAESCLARSLGAVVVTRDEPWEAWFGEGFSAFVVSVSEADGLLMESEWTELGIPWRKLGTVNATSKLEVRNQQPDGSVESWAVEVGELRRAWRKDGYWQ